MQRFIFMTWPFKKVVSQSLHSFDKKKKRKGKSEGNQWQVKTLYSVIFTMCLTYLSSNAVSFLSEGAFDYLEKLDHINVSVESSWNTCNNLSCCCCGNVLSFVKVFSIFVFYFHRDLSSNAITFLPDRAFANLRNLHKLYADLKPCMGL